MSLMSYPGHVKGSQFIIWFPGKGSGIRRVPGKDHDRDGGRDGERDREGMGNGPAGE